MPRFWQNNQFFVQLAHSLPQDRVLFEMQFEMQVLPIKAWPKPNSMFRWAVFALACSWLSIPNVGMAQTLAKSPAPPTATLRVVITNLSSSDGHIIVSLFKGDKGYPDDPGKAYANVLATFEGNQAVATFEQLPYGDYAISVLHDTNNNQKIDFNFLGIPREGYGSSNNATGVMGPPKYTAAQFDVKAPKVTHTLKLKYWL